MDLITFSNPDVSDMRRDVLPFQGGRRAYSSLLEHVLQAGSVERIIVCHPDDLPPREEYCDTRIVPCPVGALSTVARGDAVFVVNVPEMLIAAQLRAVLGVDIPICGIVASVLFPDILQTYITLAGWMRQQDYFVVPSEAGGRALQSIFVACARISRSEIMTTRLNSRLIQIPLGVEVRDVHVDRAAARAALGLDAASVLFLYVGRLTSTYKADLDPLLEAYARVRRRFHNSHLVIAGGAVEGGGYVNRLRVTVAARGLDDGVDVRADVPSRDLEALYSAADVFVSPVDNVQETFGIALLEAMEARLPVIASNWSGYRELINHQRSGILIDTCVNEKAFREASLVALFGDRLRAESILAKNTIVDVDGLTMAMMTLAGDGQLRKRYGDAGRETVSSSFSWGVVAPQYVALWKRQLDRESHIQQQGSLPFLALQDVFGHYPSLRSAEVTVSLPSAARQRAAIAASNFGEDPEAVETELLGLFSSGKSLAQWQEEGDERVANEVVRLAKKGALRIVPPDQEL